MKSLIVYDRLFVSLYLLALPCQAQLFFLLTPFQKKTFRRSIDQKQPFLKADLHVLFIWDGYNLIHVLFSQKYGVNFLFFSFFFFW